jgi:glycosyltransferase involved in cell wall biosynthesis
MLMKTLWKSAQLPFFDECHVGLRLASAIRKIVSKGTRLMKDQAFDSLVLTSDNGPALIGGYFLAKKMRLPYSLIFFDPYMGNNLGWFPNLAAWAFQPKLLKNAQHVIVCGNSLITSLRRQVDREYLSLPISVEVPEMPPNFAQVNPTTFRILYTGAVYWANADAIRSFVEAIQTLRGVEFLVYSPQSKEDLARMGVKEGEHVRFGFLPKKELSEFQRSIDLLYLPLSFSEESRKVVELATASKICEYMTSGRPILIHAPDYAYIVHYAQSENFAHVITTIDPEEIRNNLSMLIGNSGYRRRLAENAWRIVKDHHDAKKNSNILSVVLSPGSTS